MLAFVGFGISDRKGNHENNNEQNKAFLHIFTFIDLSFTKLLNKNKNASNPKI